MTKTSKQSSKVFPPSSYKSPSSSKQGAKSSSSRTNGKLRDPVPDSASTASTSKSTPSSSSSSKSSSSTTTKRKKSSPPSSSTIKQVRALEITASNEQSTSSSKKSASSSSSSSSKKLKIDKAVSVFEVPLPHKAKLSTFRYILLSHRFEKAVIDDLGSILQDVVMEVFLQYPAKQMLVYAVSVLAPYAGVPPSKVPMSRYSTKRGAAKHLTEWYIELFNKRVNLDEPPKGSGGGTDNLEK